MKHLYIHKIDALLFMATVSALYLIMTMVNGSARLPITYQQTLCCYSYCIYLGNGSRDNNTGMINQAIVLIPLHVIVVSVSVIFFLSGLPVMITMLYPDWTKWSSRRSRMNGNMG